MSEVIVEKVSLSDIFCCDGDLSGGTGFDKEDGLAFVDLMCGGTTKFREDGAPVSIIYQSEKVKNPQLLMDAWASIPDDNPHKNKIGLRDSLVSSLESSPHTPF